MYYVSQKCESTGYNFHLLIKQQIDKFSAHCHNDL